MLILGPGSVTALLIGLPKKASRNCVVFGVVIERTRVARLKCASISTFPLLGCYVVNRVECMPEQGVSCVSAVGVFLIMPLSSRSLCLMCLMLLLVVSAVALLSVSVVFSY